MSDLWPRIEPLLARVEKPARYIGMEMGTEPGNLAPRHGSGRAAFLLIYPDTYEIGLPNQGLQILYELLNEREDSVAERAYAPWTDMESSMRAAKVPLFSVDTHRAAADFDVLAFNLSAELVYTNLLNLVDLAGVPVRNEDRAPSHPIVIAGGHCTYNPEPLAEYVDAFVIGDGEEVISELAEVIGAWKRGGRATREAVLRELATIPGVYVPSLYDVTYEGPVVTSITPRYPDVPAVVDKRTVSDLAEWPYPKKQLVLLVEVVHDRLNVEIFRGCTRGCRFCQAGMITRPVRERPEDQVRTMVKEGIRRTGYDEVALTSLSSADFSGIEGVVADLVTNQEGTGGVSVSLPSLRVDAFTVGIASELQKVRRSGLTFAPEAGTWRLRQVINKLIIEDDLYSAVDAAFSQGWRRVKLYFLTGLPTEMDEDTLGIAELAKNVTDIGRKHTKQASCTVSVGGFVPKPHTPFQWFGQNGVDELQRKITLLRNATRGTREVKWHDPQATFAEGIASRGDRRIGRVIERVWRAGGTFQEWSEGFALDRWLDAMHAEGLDPDWFVTRHRTRDELLPWNHIAAGLHSDFLWDDWQEALAEHGLPDCRWTPCYDCGVCTDYALEHIVASPMAPVGGSQGTGQDLSAPAADVPVRFLGKKPTTAVVGAETAPAGGVMRGGAANPVRLRYTKLGKVRWISHRDVARALERSFRIAQLPLAFSEGFSPRPKVSFGLALSTGHESDAEYIDLVLAEELDLDALAALLGPGLPAGIEITGAVALADVVPALQEAVTCVEWRVDVAHNDLTDVDPAQLRDQVDAALASTALPTTKRRKGRDVIEDVRPVIRRITVCDEPSMTGAPASVEMEMSTQPRGAKPGEVLAAIGDFIDIRARRTHQWIERDGARQEPLDADTRPCVPEACAS